MLRATCYCVPQNQAVNAHDRADGGEDDVDRVEDDVDKGEDQADDEEGLRGQSYTWLYFGCILVTSGCISIGCSWFYLVVFLLQFVLFGCILVLIVSIWLYFGFVCLGGAEHGTAEHVRLGIKDGVGRRCCKEPFKRSFVQKFLI